MSKFVTANNKYPGDKTHNSEYSTLCHTVHVLVLSTVSGTMKCEPFIIDNFQN